MSKTYRTLPSKRNPNWIDLLGRKPGFMKHRNKERGGAKNKKQIYEKEIEEEKIIESHIYEEELIEII
mgnify:CR=1 FL=1